MDAGCDAPVRVRRAERGAERGGGDVPQALPGAPHASPRQAPRVRPMVPWSYPSLRASTNMASRPPGGFCPLL